MKEREEDMLIERTALSGDEDELSDDKNLLANNHLSKSWSLASSHEPTFTGGKVTASGREIILMPVHGDIAIVDSNRGVKLAMLRGEDAVGLEDDDEGLDHDAITSYALDHKDQVIVTCSRNNILRQYSISSEVEGDTDSMVNGIGVKLNKTWGRSGHSLPVTHMEFHPSNVFLATGSVDGTVRIWDVRGAFVTHVFRPYAGGETGGKRSISALKWKNDISQLLLSIGRDDGSITIHNLRESDDTAIILRDHVSSVTCMDWWGEDFFVSTGRDAILNLWRVVLVGELDVPKKKTKKKSSSIAQSPAVANYRRIQSVPVYEQVEGMILAKQQKSQNHIVVMTAGSKGCVRVWKSPILPGETPQLKLALEQPESEAFGEARGGYRYLTLGDTNSHDPDYIAIDAEQNLSFLSSQLRTKRTIVGHNDEILDIKMIPSSHSVAVATNSPLVKIFELDNFSCSVLKGHTATVLCLETSPCGRFLASSGKDKTLRIWDIGNQRCVGIATGHTEPIGACSLSRKIGRYEVGGKAARNGGGAFCITASIDRTMKRWNLPGATELMIDQDSPCELSAITSVRAHEKDINIVSVAPNDSLVASGSQDKTIKLWSTTDLSLRATLKGHRRGVWDCQFSPIDRVLASSSGDKTIKLWSLADFSCLRTFQGHQASVLRVRFLPTGLQLISAGADGLAKLWTIRTNECEFTLDGHTNKVWALDMSNDGRTLVSGGADSKLAVWEDNTQQIEDQEHTRKAELIVLDEKLANHLRHKEYGKAMEIALQVGKPMQVFKVVTLIIEDDMKHTKGTGLKALQGHVQNWDEERLSQILKYCRDWNTRSRNASVAMLVVKAVVTTVPVEKLLQNEGIAEILSGIIPYAERHFDRLDHLHTSTYLLDFTLSCMGALDSEQSKFVDWEKSSKFVLPPKYIDGRIQVGGMALVGKSAISDESSQSGDEDVMTLGDSSSSSDELSESDDDRRSKNQESGSDSDSS